MDIRRVISIFLIFFFVLSIGLCLAGEPKFVEGEILVKYKNKGVSYHASSLLSSLNSKYKVEEEKQLFKVSQYTKDSRALSPASVGNQSDFSLVYKIKFSKAFDAEDVAEDFSKDPNIEYAEPNCLYEACAVPDDPSFYLQWGLCNTGQLGGTSGSDIDGLNAWDIATGREDIIISVIDTGVFYEHEDLQDNMWVNSSEIPDNGVDDDSNGYVDDYRGWDFYNGDNDPRDGFYDHGTHCAGIAAAEGNNGIGVTGVCWNAKIMALKYLSDFGGGGSASNAANAILYSVNNGARVISCSWYAPYGNSQTLHDVIKYAVANGVVVCFASGNSASENPIYPAYYDECIAVAATDQSDSKATFSNYGDWIDISAPGVDIYYPIKYVNDIAPKYGYGSGTSMACPMVAGVAALILSLDSTFTSAEVREMIETSADNIYPENPVYVDKLGAGRINAFKALKMIGYSIKGNINDGTNPVSGVEIDLFGPVNKTVYTDANGDYEFTDVKIAEDYAIIPRIDKYKFSPDKIDINDIRTNLENKDFIAASIFKIKGNINDGVAPIEGISLSITGDENVTVESDANGDYVFNGLTPGGDYTITVEKEHYSFSPVSITTLNLTSDIYNQDFIGTLASFKISGRINDGINNIEGVVKLEGVENRTVVSDSSGNYVFDNLKAGGEYRILVSKFNYGFNPIFISTVNLSADLINQDFIGKAERFGIHGNITDGTNVMEGVRVTLRGPEDKIMYTDINGDYSFFDLAAGWDYRITPNSEHYTFEPIYISTYNFNGDLIDQDFLGTLLTYDISGNIRDQIGVLVGITLRLTGTENKTRGTDTEGNYSFKDLEAGGDYTVTIEHHAYTFGPVSISTVNLSGDLVQNFTKEEPTLEVSTSLVEFEDVDETKTLSFIVKNIGGSNLEGILRCDRDWIKLSHSNISANFNIIDISVYPKDFRNDGDYTGIITIDSNGGYKSILVRVETKCILTRPNPYNPGIDGGLKFYGSGVVPYDTKIQIFTISGEHVKTLNEAQGLDELTWNGRNKDGNQVKSGIYLYTSKSPKEKWIGKFTIIN